MTLFSSLYSLVFSLRLGENNRGPVLYSTLSPSLSLSVWFLPPVSRSPSLAHSRYVWDLDAECSSFGGLKPLLHEVSDDDGFPAVYVSILTLTCDNLTML